MLLTEKDIANNCNEAQNEERGGVGAVTENGIPLLRIIIPILLRS